MPTAMERIVFNLSGKPKRLTKGGREYFVVPAVLLTENVFNGSQGPLFYPDEEIAKDVGVWNHVPIVVNHPQIGGRHVSARDPDVLEEHGIGYVFNDAYEPGRRRAEGWFDVERVRAYDRRNNTDILPRLERGERIELSTGLFTTNIPGAGTFNGKSYTHTARGYKPDHVALLPSAKGACSLTDGCGFGVNEAADPADSLLSELTGLIGVNVADQVRSKVTGWFKRHGAGTGKGEAHEAAQSGAMTLDDDDKRLGADAAAQFASAGHNPATWVADEGTWERAKQAAAKYEGADEYYAVVAHIYKRMGGEVKEPTGNANEPTDTLTTEDSDMAFDKKTAVAYLTANCDCWKGREATLNALSDDDLKHLQTHVQKEIAERQKSAAVVNALAQGIPLGAATLTVNAEGKPVLRNAEGAECAPDDAECLAMVEGKKKEKAPPVPPSANAAKPQTEAEWFASAPPTIQAAVRNAMALERQEREQLADKLTANTEAGQKDTLRKFLLGKTLDELRTLALLASPAANVAAPAAPYAVPHYLGAAAGVAALNAYAGQDAEVLDLPVMNWDTAKN